MAATEQNMETKPTTDLRKNTDMPKEMLGNLHKIEVIAGLETIIVQTVSKNFIVSTVTITRI